MEKCFTLHLKNLYYNRKVPRTLLFYEVNVTGKNNNVK
jgi:hypothetical protein